MKNFKFGYARVSTDKQCLDRQLDAFERYGVDMVYTEKMTGTKKDRPELTELISRLSEGDTVVVESLSRLSRSTKDLLELAELFGNKKVNLVSLKEQIDTTTPTGKFFFTVVSAFSQFERDLIVERTNEGLKAARARGRVGGRPKVNSEKIDKAIRLYKTKEYSVKEIKDLTGVSKSTLYKNLKER